jgi:hypothetical protein
MIQAPALQPSLSRSLRLPLSLLAAAFLLACAGPQKAIDRQLIKGSIGQKYSDMTEGKSFKLRNEYGDRLLSDSLADGSVFHIHVYDYESASSTWFGTFGTVEYSYKISGFKVKDDVVQDWAYGLLTPEKKANTILGFEWGRKRSAVLDGIRRDYPVLMQTSAAQNVAIWLK